MPFEPFSVLPTVAAVPATIVLPESGVACAGAGDVRDEAALSDEKPPVEARRYDGLTLQEWRGRIQQIDFDAPAAADAVPGLLEIVSDADVPWYSRRQAALTLGRIGEPAGEAVPVLVALLEETGEIGGEPTPFWSIKALALFGPVARDAAPELIDILQSESHPPVVRLATLEALGRIGPEHPQTLPAIIGALQAPPAEDDEVEQERQRRRIAAAGILELFRGNAATAVPALSAACADESELLRRAAVRTLGVIGPPAETAITTLVDRLLFDESEDVRDLAALALAGIGPAAEPYLRQLLKDRDVAVRWRAADALGEMNRLGPDTLEALEDALTDDSPRVRLLAAEAMWTTTGDAGPPLAAVVAELGHPDREIRMQATRLLEQWGPTAEFGFDELQTLIENGDSETRQAARRVLRSWEE